MNPEDDVVDEIDRLVTESLNHGQPVYKPVAVCTLCGTEWHGMRGDGSIGLRGCPGAFATVDEIHWWRTRSTHTRKTHAMLEKIMDTLEALGVLDRTKSLGNDGV